MRENVSIGFQILCNKISKNIYLNIIKIENSYIFGSYLMLQLVEFIFFKVSYCF